MSRIGKKLISIPPGVEIKIDPSIDSGRAGQTVAVKGPKGELKRQLPKVLSVEVAEGMISVKPRGDVGLDKEVLSLWGLGRAMIASMIVGVTEGFKKELEFNGVGFKAQVKGSDLELILGYTNPVLIKGPAGVTFQVEKGTITVSGIDKEMVGHVAAQIRAARLPEPYKGTGIKYKEEVIRRKAGKKAVATS